MLTENQFGVTFDVINFPSETKKKIIKLRNIKIRNGQENFTCGDALVYAINCAYHLEKMAEERLNKKKYPEDKPDGNDIINNNRPDLSNRIKKDGSSGNI